MLLFAINSFFSCFVCSAYRKKTNLTLRQFIKVDLDHSKEYVGNFKEISQQPVHPLPNIAAIKGECFLYDTDLFSQN